MDHVSVVVDDMEAAARFFRALGLEVEGSDRVEGDWVDRINGIAGLKLDITMLRTPDGHGRLELTRFHHPAAVGAPDDNARPNMLGLRSVMFEVDDLDDALRRLEAEGGSRVGEVVDYETFYRLCYVRGPAGVIVSLAEKLG
jgi:catechol 2,3-dioxygenase-like lactoylglutathione lyase family enzyme